MKRFIRFVLLLFAAPAFAQSYAFAHYTGAVGKYKVELEFSYCTSDSVTGHYRYIGKRGMLRLNGSVRNNSITLKEYSGNQTGEWTGSVAGDGSINGTWTSADGKRKLPFTLAVDSTTGLSGYRWSAKADTAYMYTYNDRSWTVGSCVVDVSGIQITGAKAAVEDSIDGGFMYYGEKMRKQDADDYARMIVTNESGYLGEEKPEIDSATGEPVIYASNALNYSSATGVAWNLAGIFTTGTHAYGYSGGAHGWYATGYRSYDMHTGAAITLDDIFLDGYQKPLQQLVDRQLRTDDEYGGCFWEEQIPLNDNFYFTAEGITFYYNIYEIAPYVCGAFETTLAWEDISKWIDPKGPMGWVK